MSRATWLKTPKTTQERRMSCAHQNFVRAKRNLRNIPCAWDDNVRSDHTSRSWKDRKVQSQWM